MTAKFIAHEAGKTKTFEVTSSGLTIGRHADNQASLDDSRLSRFHARIKFKDGDWYAEDLGSTNGSFINDKKFCGEVKISSGDKLRFGATDAELVWEDAAAASKPAASPKKTARLDPPKATPEANDLKTAATIVAPLSSLVKELPPDVAAAAPAAAGEKSPASPIKQMKTVIHKPAAGGALRPGLKLPPKPAAGLKPGLKLPPKPTGLKPGIKLPPKTSFQLKPGIKLPPKPGAK